MNLLEALAQRPRIIAGRGTNHEGQHFVGRLEVQPLMNGSAMLPHTATGLGGEHFHAEATLLGMSADTTLCL